jgi:hypothetical protein
MGLTSEVVFLNKLLVAVLCKAMLLLGNLRSKNEPQLGISESISVAVGPFRHIPMSLMSEVC